MDKNCDKCVYHIGGACDLYECQGTVTLSDYGKYIYNKALEDFESDILSNEICQMNMNGTCWEEIENIAERLER